MAEVVIERVNDTASVDFATVFSILRSAFAYMDDRIDPPSSLQRMTIDDLRKKARDELLVLASLDGELIGCMFCKPTRKGSTLYVGKVAVAPSWQRKDIGKALFSEAFQIALEQNFAELELETRVELEENHRAFERLGFSEVNRYSHVGYDHPTSIMMRAPVEPQ